METLTQTKTRKKTINQLLDMINEIPIDSMTQELGEKRQRLIDLKKLNQAAGGKIIVDNTSNILVMINAAKHG